MFDNRRKDTKRNVVVALWVEVDVVLHQNGESAQLFHSMIHTFPDRRILHLESIQILVVFTVRCNAGNSEIVIHQAGCLVVEFYRDTCYSHQSLEKSSTILLLDTLGNVID